MRGLTVGELIEQLGLYEDDTQIEVEVDNEIEPSRYVLSAVETSTKPGLPTGVVLRVYR